MKLAPVERRPSGSAGLTAIYLRLPREPSRWPGLEDCLVARLSAHRLVIWEPLRTKAPSPALASPHCCYSQTVIFYHRPYIVRPWTRLYWANGRLRPSEGGFEQWDQIESRLGWDNIVEFEGEQFQTGGGAVVWARGRWWMRYGAARRQARAAA